jgi:hypothetical protein
VAWFMMVGLVVLATTFLVTRPRPDASSVGNGVVNPSAARNLSDWRAATDEGTIRLDRVRSTTAPGGAASAVAIVRTGTGGDWTHVLIGLRRPESFIRTGLAYRLQVYVRDRSASGHQVGLLLANSNFRHRPTQASRYAGWHDRAWHLLERTFIADRDGQPDTAVYLDLPSAGPLDVEVTGASLRRVALAKPPRSDRAPDQVLTFAGPAGGRPDPAVWGHDLGGNGWGAGELQSYTSHAANAHLDGRGHLVVEAGRQTIVGTDGIRRRYTSARLSTEGRLAVPPGSYVEATLKATTADGLRPAFWLIGSNFRQVGWPSSGELDAMEASGKGANAVRQTIHLARRSDPRSDGMSEVDETRGVTTMSDARSAWHRYGVYFDRSLVQFYVDGRPRLYLSRSQAREDDLDWPFGQSQHLLLNLAVASPPRPQALPATMTVSRVAIWRHGVPYAS